ncbi:Uncharacterized protein OBRU01_08588, partial [Operophtera brumata]
MCTGAPFCDNRILLDKVNAGGDTAHAAITEATEAFKKISHNMWLHLATDFERYKLSTEPWKRFASENEIVTRADASLLSNWGGGFVLGVGGEESSHLRQYSPGPLGHVLEDVAPLTSNDIGRLVFSLSRATNAVGAYNKAKSILSASVYEAVVTEKCPSDVITKSLMNYLRQIDSHYN